jgi:hypothetical protein
VLKSAFRKRKFIFILLLVLFSTFFLYRHLTFKNCQEREFVWQGVIFNLKVEGESIVFDFNDWDLINRESVYHENINLPLNKNISDLDINNANYLPVRLEVKMVRKRNSLWNRLFVCEEEVQEFSLEEISFTEEEYNSVVEVLKSAINQSPLAEDVRGAELGNSGIPVGRGFITFVEEVEGDYRKRMMDMQLNLSLYRPWILSYIYDFGDKEVEKNEIVKLLKFDINELTIDMVGEDRCQFEDVESEEGEKIQEEPIRKLDLTRYQYRNRLACTILAQIEENIGGFDDEKIYILEKYCSLDYFNTSIEDTIEELKEDISDTAKQDYIFALEQSVLDSEQDDAEGIVFPPSNISSLLVDSFMLNRLYSEVEGRPLEVEVNFVINYVFWSESFNLENICSIKYFTDIYLENRRGNTVFDKMSSITNEIVSSPEIEISKRLDEDPSVIFLCFEESDIESNFLRSFILKTISLNLYDNEERLGIWINDTYDVSVNARFLKLLLLNKDILVSQ